MDRSKISRKAVMYLINHVFLPPKLPQQDDLDIRHESVLVDLVIDALAGFKSHLNYHQAVVITSLQTLMVNLKTVHSRGIIDEGQLCNALSTVVQEGGTIPLHVRAQNAGLLISKSGTSLRMEAFELSPTNKAVMGCKGRLLRDFPGVALLVKEDVFQQPGLQAVIADTLATMSHQRAAGTQPRVRKAAQMHDEDRDTAHPKVVTDLFLNFMRPFSEVINDEPCLRKHTREEVNWLDDKGRWGRSGLWLLIRVALQLDICRSPFNKDVPGGLYKQFMVFFMSQVLDISRRHSVSSDYVYSMNAKLVRRLLKLESCADTPVLRVVRRIVEATNSTIKERWAGVIKEAEPGYDLSRLKSLLFRRDTNMTLPALDEYLQALDKRSTMASRGNFDPGPSPITYSAINLPKIVQASSSGMITYNLVALEDWVAENLASWLDRNLHDPETCGKLSELLQSYHAHAKASVTGNPEATSRMILTIFELWVACDKSAITLCDFLQEYDHGLKHELLTSLLAPPKSHMQRVLRLEDHLQSRRLGSKYQAGYVFHKYGEHNSFQIKYFDQSSRHQQLRSKIELEAKESKKRKLEELETKKKEHASLTVLHQSAECDCDQDNDPVDRECLSMCKKSQYLRALNSISIQCYEWPLPMCDLEAKTTVFELRVPPWFGHWRDATMYLKLDVLCLDYAEVQTPRSTYCPSNYSGLSSHFRSFNGSQRLGLLSQAKPHQVTHRRDKFVGSITKDDVCLNNGLRYQYYDTRLGCFVTSTQMTEVILRQCMFTLPAGVSSVQQFLFRPHFAPNGPPPNTVIASQSESSWDMALQEYKLLGSLPLGCRIQWQNLLRELCMPTVDFKKVETELVILQTIYQIGPRKGDDVLRDGHTIINDQDFATKLLRALTQALQRIEENWESSQALSTFITVATRVLSLTSSREISEQTVHFLTYAREVAFRWVSRLIEKASSATNDDQRALLRMQVVEIALICTSSFDLEGPYLDRTLSEPKHASVLIQCSIIIQEQGQAVSGSTNRITNLLYWRWKCLSCRSYPIISAAVDCGNSAAVHLALKSCWPGYDDNFSPWRRVSANSPHWIFCESKSANGNLQLSVHLNLLTGELLVNHYPLARLPSRYEHHPRYHTLFGHSAVEIMPSSVPGMQFSGKRTYLGYALHFNCTSEKTAFGCRINEHEDFLLRATRNGRTFELLPTRLLHGHFPTAFIDGFVHWLDVDNSSVIFRPIDNPWTPFVEDWMMVKNVGQWSLLNHRASLISIKSDTGRLISEMFSPLEECLHIHTVLDPSYSRVDIELPRLQLTFHLQQHTSDLLSRQFRGMKVDDVQCLGTLVGLVNKIVLKHSKTEHRIVILPEGQISYQLHGGHVHVNILKDSVKRAHSYQINSQIGKLTDNGSLESKLFLCYLHGLTSFCLPDPLTNQTGTEQALQILESAAVRSFPRLTEDNLAILQKIAQLTPGRIFYPQDIRDMQTVKWQTGLGFIAQHGQYHKAVKNIFDQAATYNMFDQETTFKAPDMDRVDMYLLERDLIRTSTFRVSGFGAEDFTDKHDEKYMSRDRYQDSAAGSKVFIMSSIVFNKSQYLHYPVSHTLKTQIWDIGTRLGTVYGPHRPISPTIFAYDSTMLLEFPDLIAEDWASLQKYLGHSRSKINKFKFMIWLSTLAFRDTANVQIIQALAMSYLSSSLPLVSAPATKSYCLALGTHVKAQGLEKTIYRAHKPMAHSPEGSMPRNRNESHKSYQRRIQRSYDSNVSTAFEGLNRHLRSQWPCETPKAYTTPGLSFESGYINIDQAEEYASPYFKARFENLQYYEYLARIVDALQKHTVKLVKLISLNKTARTVAHFPDMRQTRGFVGINHIFESVSPSISAHHDTEISPLVNTISSTNSARHRIHTLIEALTSVAQSPYEIRYLEDLSKSLASLRTSSKESTLLSNEPTIKQVLDDNLKHCKDNAVQIYDELHSILVSSNTLDGSATTAARIGQWPRVSPAFLLQQLSRHRWSSLSQAWKTSIVAYGIALTEVHRAERLVTLIGNPTALLKELQNGGHTNWDPIDQPESLLLEIESGIMIREVQEHIASQMRSPPTGKNSVMQLNMGEGKSSVIVPMVAAYLADNTRLVRVLVAKPQAKQMYQMLVSKLGGMLDRRIYHMPFSRSLKLSEAQANAIGQLYRECMKNGGILLVQPEHLLSFKLMVLERFSTGQSTDKQVAKSLLATQRFFDDSSRDIVDESDENFSVKFELIYTMGAQKSIEFSPDRWICIQEVLQLICHFAPEVKRKFTDSIELDSLHFGKFPRLRILRADAGEALLQSVAKHICNHGLSSFPILRQSSSVRDAVYTYLTKLELSKAEVDRVEDKDPGSFYTDSTKDMLLLLRGLIAGGVLAFALGQKRWRVNYGLDSTRRPSTKLAVPYRAKDQASVRSEFSHPDVVIVLTLLTYYYGGLEDVDLSTSFQHLLKSDQADDEYLAWTSNSPSLPKTFKDLLGINLKDEVQFAEQVFPHLRYSKGAIDYFLAQIVFPKEMKEFPSKLSASGWDVGQVKTNPTTGFSGTNDSRQVLPLSVQHLDLDEQEHTNALVLEYLLGHENSVFKMPARGDGHVSDAEALLTMVIKMQPEVRVILDVGAQILELDNLQLATTWLRMTDNASVQAVIYVNNDDDVCVLDRSGKVEQHQTSPYATQPDLCLVYLDESHTRGIDLVLPLGFRAAVTLGANLTKDRLVQACMRMRQLGQGHSVVFCVPEEIQIKILTLISKPRTSDITVSDVLLWAISETFLDIRRSMPLWAVQGRRYENQCAIWNVINSAGKSHISQSQAEQFFEDEAQSLQTRYGPRQSDDLGISERPVQVGNFALIAERCREFRGLDVDSATLHEEQERELSPEIEQERQLERPAPADPAKHILHAHISSFVINGDLVPKSDAYMAAFISLRTTSAAKHLDVTQFPQDLLVTADFARTIQTPTGKGYESDDYQRPVQWVLTSRDVNNVVKHMLIISEYEAQELLPLVKVSKTTSLHLYAPRQNLSFAPLDSLDLFTLPTPSTIFTYPRHLILQLNLFAGQLYLSSFEEYVEVCNMLGLAWEKSADGCVVTPDGFILKAAPGTTLNGTFSQSPNMFLKALLSRVRRNNGGIEKTHLGKMLDGTLTRSDFEDVETDIKVASKEGINDVDAKVEIAAKMKVEEVAEDIDG